MRSQNGPTRTCIGCRRRSPVGELLRVVVQDGVVVLDERRRLLGRGAHVHSTPGCIETAVSRRAFARALRAPVADVSALQALIEAPGDGPNSRTRDSSDSRKGTQRPPAG